MGENFEYADEIDKEDKGEIEEMENKLGAKTKEIRPHLPIPNYNSYDNKMRLESTDKNTHGENMKIDSAVTISYNDNSKITTIKELEAKQIIIEVDKIVHERRDRKLLHIIEEDKVD